MKKLDAFIEEHKERFLPKIEMLPAGTMAQAEEQFGFKFDDTIKELYKYKYLAFGSVDILDISSYPEYGTGLPTSSAYSQLKDLKEQVEESGKKLPSDKIIPIEFLDEWTIVYSLEDQNLYCIQYAGYEKEAETLEEYILNRFNTELEELLEEEE